MNQKTNCITRTLTTLCILAVACMQINTVNAAQVVLSNQPSLLTRASEQFTVFKDAALQLGREKVNEIVELGKKLGLTSDRIKAMVIAAATAAGAAAVTAGAVYANKRMQRGQQMGSVPTTSMEQREASTEHVTSAAQVAQQISQSYMPYYEPQATQQRIISPEEREEMIQRIVAGPQGRKSAQQVRAIREEAARRETQQQSSSAW